MVIIGHSSIFISQSDEGGSSLVTHVQFFGALGVRVFFVISGFLITSLLLTELASGKIHLPRFYFRRTLRIFPPFYCLILITSLLSMKGFISLNNGDVWAAGTYTSNYHQGGWSLGHTWSLSVEEQFYLLWPATLYLFGAKKGLVLAGAMLIVCPTLRLCLPIFFPESAWGLDYRFETVADSIAVGCLLAGTRGWLNSRVLYRKLKGSKLFILVPILVLLFGFLADTRFGFWIQTLGFSLVNVGIAVCVDWSISNPSTKFGSLLNTKILVRIGVMSYSIYLWQQLFLGPARDVLFQSYYLNIFMVSLASLASYQMIESPALQLRHYLEPIVFGARPVQVVNASELPVVK